MQRSLIFALTLLACSLFACSWPAKAHAGGTAGDVPFQRGDCNADGAYNIGDAIHSLNSLFNNAALECLDACDLNDDGQLDISDPIWLLGNLFSNGAPPAPPFLVCGLDPSLDGLGCLNYPACNLFPPLIIEPGQALLEGNGQITLDIPADFFTPGSLPIFIDLPLLGLPLEVAGPFEIGSTNMVIERLGTMELEVGQTAPVPIQMVELDLVGVDPITVVTGNGDLLWDVQVRLSDQPLAPGTLTATREHENGGIYTADFLVKPVFIFTNPNNGDVLTLEGNTELLQGAGDWFMNGHDLLTPFHVPPFFLGGFSSPTMQLDFAPALPLPHPPAIIQPGALIDPAVGQLGRDAIIEPGAQIGPDVIIGPNAQIGANAIIGAGAVIGNSAVIGPDCFVGPGCVIDDGTMLLPFVQLQTGSVIEELCIIEFGAQIGSQVRIGANSFVGQNAFIGNDVRLGEQVQVGNFASIEDLVVVGDGMTIFDNELLIESLVECLLPDGTIMIVPASLCPGAVLLEIPGMQNDYLVAPTDEQTVQIQPNALPPGLQGLANDVDDSGVAPANGGQNWTRSTHDCDDFADDLEQYLQGEGYDATFTCIWEVNKKRAFWQIWKPRLINGHALTDVHLNGQALWIEPQRSSGQGAIGVDMDRDGDGVVEYDTSPGSAATDGCYRIEVYTSRAACEAAGRVLD